MEGSSFEQDSIENQTLACKLEMQISLAKKRGEDFETEYIPRHAKVFGDYFEQHPELVDRYKEDQVGVLDEIEKVVYH